VSKKSLTADQVQAKQDKAVQFLRDVVGDDNKADDFENMSLDEYAEHKGITITNPRRGKNMANGSSPTKQDLQDQIDELQEENQDLRDQLDAIADIVTPSDEDDDYDDDDDN
jgi:hypothetical protein